MSKSEFGSRLFDIVPSVYRNRDDENYGGNGDFQRYLEGAGHLLDDLHALIRQCQADNFPDNPIDGSPACQDWLIPYFAELLDVRLVSPLPDGQRDEVANAVRWRKGKGTLQVMESIAEAIGQWEVVIQEGWKRVATTPRIDAPLLPVSVHGYTGIWQYKHPSLSARHPGLSAVTVDYRCPAVAVASNSGDAGARYSTIDGDERIWRQGGYHGAPCHPGSYDDSSLRSVDFRDSDWRKGHFHPGKLLLFVVPPSGWFTPGQELVNYQTPVSDRFEEFIEIIEEYGVKRFRNRSLDQAEFQPVEVQHQIELGSATNPGIHTWKFEGLILKNTVKVSSGKVSFDSCAVRRVESVSSDVNDPVIYARNTLFDSLEAGSGLVELEYCTVLKKTLVRVINASDCIFNDLIHRGGATFPAPVKGCIRYSAVKAGQLKGVKMTFARLSREPAVFFTDHFGDRSCGVLHPACPSSISQGAEDGTEMGAYHFFSLGLLAEAVQTKLKDFVQLGLEPVVIPDQELTNMPG